MQWLTKKAEKKGTEKKKSSQKEISSTSTREIIVRKGTQ